MTYVQVFRSQQVESGQARRQGFFTRKIPSVLVSHRVGEMFTKWHQTCAHLQSQFVQNICTFFFVFVWTVGNGFDMTITQYHIYLSFSMYSVILFFQIGVFFLHVCWLRTDALPFEPPTTDLVPISDVDSPLPSWWRQMFSRYYNKVDKTPPAVPRTVTCGIQTIKLNS